MFFSWNSQSRNTITVSPSEPFLLATWNIGFRRNTGLTSAAKGLAQMGVNCAVVTKVKKRTSSTPGACWDLRSSHPKR